MDIKWNCCFKSPEDRTILEDFLPKQQHYKYVVNKFVITERADILYETKFESDVLVNVCSVEKLDIFKKDFEQISLTSYNRSTKINKNRGKILESGKLLCIHNVSKRVSKKTNQIVKDKTPNKNTHCPGHISFSLKKNDEDHKHTDIDDVCPCFNLKISFVFQHNHEILTGAAQKFLKVGEEAVKFYEDLYLVEDSPGAAYRKFQTHLKQQYGEDRYVSVSANRQLNPEYPWVFWKFALFRKNKFGSVQGPDMFERTEELINQYNSKQSRQMVKMKQYESGDYFIAASDPFGRRVQSLLPACGDVILVDATSNMNGRKIIQFYCAKCCWRFENCLLHCIN